MSGGTKQFSFRLWWPYPEKIQEQARQAGIKPNQYLRIAAMTAADHEFLSIDERLTRHSQQLDRVIDELIRLRKDFADALE